MLHLILVNLSLSDTQVNKCTWKIFLKQQINARINDFSNNNQSKTKTRFTKSELINILSTFILPENIEIYDGSDFCKFNYKVLLIYVLTKLVDSLSCAVITNLIFRCDCCNRAKNVAA